MIYKLFHGSNLLTCNEQFVIGKSIVGLVIWKVVKVINVVFRNLISWPMGQKMEVVMLEFKYLCSLPNVHSAINDTNFSISKPNLPFVKDYFYHKIGRYSIVA